jgi:N4-gp56 family major capsid protein
MAQTQTTNLPASIRDVYSREIIREAQPRLRFAQFAKRKMDLLQNAGGSVKFTKYANIAKGGKLTEGTNMDEKAMSNSEITITVDEYGNAVNISEKALQTSIHNELAEASIALANDMSKVLDEALRDVALTTTNFVYGGQKSVVTDLVVGDGLTTTTVKDAVEALEVANAPKIGGEYYICIAHPHQLRQIRDDSAWINAHSYVGVDNIYRGEVGMYEGVRFISTTQMPANSAVESETKFGFAGGSGIPTWEAVIFGENSFGWAEATQVEMRDNGVVDYGRTHGIAWYAIWGFGLIEEKNIYAVVTA